MRRRLSNLLCALMLVVLWSGAIADVRAATETPTPTAEILQRVGQDSVRVRPSPRPYDNPHSQPSGDGLRSGRKLETLEDSGPPRLDDPVLQWLPEITKASDATGTPLSLIAGIMRIESNGDPKIVSPQGAQGLMQVMPDELLTQGILSEKWLDPPTNVMAGAVILAQRSGNGWESAAAYYFGIGCDYYGTCTYGYAVAIIGWANAYAELLGDGMWYDTEMIPDVPDSPEPTETPTESPTSTAEATGTPTVTPTVGEGTPTSVPVDATDVPTEVPTDEPTAIPTDEPTAIPTEVPTEIPTEAPTEEPVPTDEASPTDGNVTDTGNATDGG